MRLVRPVALKAAPISRLPKMKKTEGSMKSVMASRGARISHRACTTAMARPVTPAGRTSKIHHTPASMNRPMAALPSWLRAAVRPAGSTASGRAGDR